jgi:ABC-type branched-subunit amino acid transport system substrate-binding protein
MWRRGVVGLGVVVLVAAGCGGGGKSGNAGTTAAGATAATSQKVGTLTIANFNPFSGGDADFGPEMVAGCIPAVKLINEAGGVLGNKVACDAVDTRGDPADAVPAASKMLATTSHLVGVLGPSADEAQATVPVIDAAKVPMFADTGEAAFDKSTYAYFYRLTPADDVKGYALAQWAHDKGYTRAAAVFGSDIGAQSDVPTLLTAFQKLGGTIVSNQKLALDQSSYRTEVTKMLAAKPQVIFTEADPQTDATFLSELKQLHGLIPVIGTETTLQANWLKAVGGAIGAADLGKYVTGMQPYAPTSGPAWTAYNKALLASAKQVPKPSQWSGDPYTMTYYDGVNLIALAIDAANSVKPETFAPWIVKLTKKTPGATTVYSYAQGQEALAAGKTIRYVGAGGEIAFDKWHNSSGAYEAAQSVNGTVKIVGTVTSEQIAALSK